MEAYKLTTAAMETFWQSKSTLLELERYIHIMFISYLNHSIKYNINNS